MNSPKIPPHPLGFRCDNCMFWNKALQQEVILQPNGQAIPKAVAIQMGMPLLNVSRAKISVCQLFPKWESTMAEAYCWNHRNYDPSAFPPIDATD